MKTENFQNFFENSHLCNVEIDNIQKLKWSDLLLYTQQTSAYTTHRFVQEIILLPICIQVAGAMHTVYYKYFKRFFILNNFVNMVPTFKSEA